MLTRRGLALAFWTLVAAPLDFNHDDPPFLMTFRNTADPRLSGSVSVQVCAALIAFAGTQGANRLRLVRAAGLSESELAKADGRVSLPRFLTLTHQARIMTGQPGLVVRFASHADFSEVSLAGMIANASKTMLDALTQLNRYARLTFQLPFEGKTPLRFEHGEDADWIVDQRLATQAAPEFAELAFTYLITGPRRFLPHPHVERVYLQRAEPEYSDVLEEIWQCPIVYEQSRNALRLPKWVAGHPVALEPAYAFGILTAHADREIERLQATETFTGQVRKLILPRLHTGEVSVEWAAGALGLSRQAVYRRLKAEGRSFEDLLSELRCELAKAYLAGGKTSIAETAYLLGYAEPSPFSRAFKRWTGMSPDAFRRGATAPAKAD